VEEGRSGYVKFKAGFLDDERGEHLPAARGELRHGRAKLGQLLDGALSVTDPIEAKIAEEAL
jgi:hypothetical protein